MIQPKTLPGFMELLPEKQILFNQMKEKIQKSYEKFGFLPIDTPIIEMSEILLAKAGGETEKQIYQFEKGDNNLSLRLSPIRDFDPKEWGCRNCPCNIHSNPYVSCDCCSCDICPLGTNKNVNSGKKRERR